MIKLQAGDIFCVAPPVGKEFFVARSIAAISARHELDGACQASHAGIITNADGDTFEALSRCYMRQYNVLQTYAGCRLLIARHIDMTPAAFEKGFSAVSHLEGRAYPFWRLALFARSPLLAKWIHFKKGVCSENTFQVLSACNLRRFLSGGLINYWWGVAPAHVEDAARGWDVFDVIHDTFNLEEDCHVRF